MNYPNDKQDSHECRFKRTLIKGVFGYDLNTKSGRPDTAKCTVFLQKINVVIGHCTTARKARVAKLGPECFKTHPAEHEFVLLYDKNYNNNRRMASICKDPFAYDKGYQRDCTCPPGTAIHQPGRMMDGNLVLDLDGTGEHILELPCTSVGSGEDPSEPGWHVVSAGGPGVVPADGVVKPVTPEGPPPDTKKLPRKPKLIDTRKLKGKALQAATKKNEVLMAKFNKQMSKLQIAEPETTPEEPHSHSDDGLDHYGLHMPYMSSDAWCQALVEGVKTSEHKVLHHYFDASRSLAQRVIAFEDETGDQE